MKKAIVVCIVSLAVLSLATDGYCQGPIRKLGRGLANIVACPLEIPKNIRDTYKDKGPIDAIALGIPKGVAMTALRLVMGIIETATFPVPIPENYEPALNPEFPWQ